MAIVDQIRRAPARSYLVATASHSPAVDLHLGDLGGPFLRSDVLTRHLRMLGHEVVSVGATDAHDPRLLAVALADDRSPTTIASDNYQAASRDLAAFHLTPDSFLDGAAKSWVDEYDDASRRIARHMADSGRLVRRPVQLPWSRALRRYVVGPFAAGRCPSCDADASGMSCAACGMWFSPDLLVDVHHRGYADEPLTWKSIPLTYLAPADEFTRAEVESRFGADYGALFDRYVELNGQRILLNHPLGWGVPWTIPPTTDQLVHCGHGTGAYAVIAAYAREYQRLSTSEAQPFARDSTVETVLTAGHEVVMPSIYLISMMDEDLDWQPFRVNVINRSMRLEGERFDPTGGHVITAARYVEFGLSTDAFRWYAATIYPDREEANISLEALAQSSTETLHQRLGAMVEQAMAGAGSEQSEPLAGPAMASVRRVLGAQMQALRLPAPGLRSAARLIDDWMAAGSAGLVTESPYWWLKTMSALSYPIMPEFGAGLWQCLAEGDVPSLAAFEDHGRGVHGRPPRVPPMAVDTVRRAMSVADHDMPLG